MAITYSVGVDGDDDGVIGWGDFDGDDFTQVVIALEWRLGLAQPYDSMAALSTATVTLRNQSRRFSPEASVSPLQPGRTLQIRSHDGVTERVHFTGMIQRVEPLAGDQGQRSAVIHAQGAEAQLSQHRVRLPPQVGQRADQVINAVLDAAPLRRRVLAGRWVLGLAGYSELGTSTRLPDITIPRSLEAGRSTFAYVGDTWHTGIAASAAIGEMAEAERGRFLINRAGEAVFYNRHHLLLDTHAQAAFSDDMRGLHYAYGEEVVSRVQVNLIPRSIGAQGSVLWRLENAQAVSAASTQRLIARFRDEDKRPVGALSLTQIMPGVDYQVNTQADGAGNDLTARVTISVIEASFSAAVLEIRNASRRDVFVLPGLELRGTPVLHGDPVTVEQASLYAQAFYGSSTVSLDLPALDSIEQADQIARFELARREKPRGVARALTLDAHLHPQAALALTLFDRITLTETQTAHSAAYFIVAEAHRVDHGGARHHVTWTLESASANTFWLLGQHRLDMETVLAY